MRGKAAVFSGIASLLVGSLLPATAIAKNAKPSDVELIQRCAQQPVVIGAQLSPDGTRLALLSSMQGKYHLIIASRLKLNCRPLQLANLSSSNTISGVPLDSYWTRLSLVS